MMNDGYIILFHECILEAENNHSHVCLRCRVHPAIYELALVRLCLYLSLRCVLKLSKDVLAGN